MLSLIATRSSQSSTALLRAVVATCLLCAAASNVGGLNISVPTAAAVKKVLLTSVSGSTTVKVVALVRASSSSMSVNSWRVAT